MAIVVGSVILVVGGTLAGFFGTYTVIWALVELGHLDRQYEIDYLNTLNAVAFDHDILRLGFTLFRYPIDTAQNILARSIEEDNFNVNNEGLLVMFFLTTFPVLYMTAAQLDIFNLALIPFLMVFYTYDQDIFIDWDKTKELESPVPIPRSGLPTWWAEYYGILAM